MILYFLEKGGQGHWFFHYNRWSGFREDLGVEVLNKIKADNYINLRGSGELSLTCIVPRKITPSPIS
jgi:hypothetical protein